jgi:hypothetical protein
VPKKIQNNMLKKGTKDYPLVAILWEDHTQFRSEHIGSLKEDRNLITLIKPSLSIGFIFKETAKMIILVSTLERYDDRDEADFIVILKGCIVSIKEYGTIALAKLK